MRGIPTEISILDVRSARERRVWPTQLQTLPLSRWKTAVNPLTGSSAFPNFTGAEGKRIRFCAPGTQLRRYFFSLRLCPFSLHFLHIPVCVRKCQYNRMFLGLSSPDGVQRGPVTKRWSRFHRGSAAPRRAPALRGGPPRLSPPAAATGSPPGSEQPAPETRAAGVSLFHKGFYTVTPLDLQRISRGEKSRVGSRSAAVGARTLFLGETRGSSPPPPPLCSRSVWPSRAEGPLCFSAAAKAALWKFSLPLRSALTSFGKGSSGEQRLPPALRTGAAQRNATDRAETLRGRAKPRGSYREEVSQGRSPRRWCSRGSVFLGYSVSADSRKFSTWTCN